MAEVALTSDEVLKELTSVARAEWREFLEVKRNRKGEVVDARLNLRDKIRALELMGKYHGLFKENAKNPVDAARAALLDLRARFPELSEERLRQIVAETFDIQESELIN